MPRRQCPECWQTLCSCCEHDCPYTNEKEE